MSEGGFCSILGGYLWNQLSLRHLTDEGTQCSSQQLCVIKAKLKCAD